MILQIGIIFLFLALGELIVALTGVPVPSSIIGMILLTSALSSGVLDFRRVDKAAEFLVKNLGFFFIPAGVGLVNCFGLIADEWLPVVVATLLSTVIVIAVTGHAHQFLRRRFSSSSSRQSIADGIPD